jgi:DNA-binding NarL/FixJ family response regulator
VIRVLVVDDHHYFRSCLVALLAASDDIDVVGECEDGSEVLAAVQALQPDVVVLDVRMPQRSGLEVAADLQREHPRVAVIILTGDSSSAAGRAVAKVRGVAEHLLKGGHPGLVLDAVRRAGAAVGPHWAGDPGTG